MCKYHIINDVIDIIPNYLMHYGTSPIYISVISQLLSFLNLQHEQQLLLSIFHLIADLSLDSNPADNIMDTFEEYPCMPRRPRRGRVHQDSCPDPCVPHKPHPPANHHPLEMPSQHFPVHPPPFLFPPPPAYVVPIDPPCSLPLMHYPILLPYNLIDVPSPSYDSLYLPPLCIDPDGPLHWSQPETLRTPSTGTYL